MIKLSNATKARLRTALAEAFVMEEQARGRQPTGGEVIFRALENAVETLRRMPDPDRRFLAGNGKSPWPGLMRTPEEREECYRQMMWLVIKGLASDDILVSKPAVSPTEMATMDDILYVFRELLVHKTKGRDWRIMVQLAGGRTARRVAMAMEPRMTRASVHDRKQLQCTAISSKLLAILD
jgi:hypothetical protein